MADAPDRLSPFDLRLIYLALFLLWGLTASLVGVIWTIAHRTMNEVILEQRLQGKEDIKTMETVRYQGEQLMRLDVRMLRLEGMALHGFQGGPP